MMTELYADYGEKNPSMDIKLCLFGFLFFQSACIIDDAACLAKFLSTKFILVVIFAY